MTRAFVANPFRLFSLVVLLAVALPALAVAGAVTQLTTNAQDDTSTDAAVDVAGNVHVVYERAGSIYYRGRTGTTWSVEELVSPGSNPAVGAGGSGTPQVAFLSGGSVWYTARVGGTWTSPVTIAPGSYVDMAVDAAGVAHVIYLNDTYGDGYRDINYTNNGASFPAFPPGPMKVWNSWYYYDGWGRSAEYFFDFNPLIAVDAAGNYVIAYCRRWISGGGGFNDWGSNIHVYLSASDVDLSNADLYKGYYPAPARNGLTLADPGTAFLAFGSTLATTSGGAWGESSLPAGSYHTLDTSFVPDPPTAVLHVAYVNATGGIEYAQNTGSGFGTPLVLSATTTGRYPVVIAESDPFVAFEAIDSVDYEVWFARTTNLDNLDPVLDPIGDRSVDEGATLSFATMGSDPEGQPVTHSVSNLPPGATYDAEYASFNWTPDHTQAGTYTVTFYLSDGIDSVSETITITVNQVNAPPVLGAVGNRPVDENSSLSFTLSATDIDGNGLTFGATNLPEGAGFDPLTATFSWTPAYDQAGTYPGIVFTVTDDGIPNLADSETITITVNDVNRPPVLGAVGDKTADEGGTLAFTVSATDADGHGLTYGATNLPAGAGLDPATGAFSWSPTYEQAGSYPGIVLTVTDDGTPHLDDTETITITVNPVNAPPVLAPIGDRSVSEGALLTFVVSATDVDSGDTLAFGASGLPTGATFDPATRTFSWTPDYDQAGSHAGIVFTVTDDGTPGKSDSETVTITVDNVNRAPVLDPIGDRSVMEGHALTFTASATDEDGETLNYSASNLPAGATFDPATRTFSWTPGYDQAGEYAAVVFSVADAVASDSESITITVTDNPTPPGFFTVTPCRLIDTRAAAGDHGGPALVAGADRTFDIVAGACGIPASARAISVNVTVAQPTAAGNLRLFPAGVTAPNVSTINYSAGQTRGNNAIVRLNDRGEMTVRCAQASGTTAHFILDVNGYFQEETQD